MSWLGEGLKHYAAREITVLVAVAVLVGFSIGLLVALAVYLAA